MRVALRGEIEHAVGGMQVPSAAVAVGEALDRDLAEDGREASNVAGLDGPSRDSLRVHDRVQPWLVLRAQGEMILEELAEQLTRPDVEGGLELRVGEPARLVALEKLHYAGKARTRRTERPLRSGHRLDHDATSSAAYPLIEFPSSIIM
jgi:hypothetical protein